MDFSEIRDAAKKAREIRKEQQDVIHGFCYENAQEMSRQLRRKGINHRVEKVGIMDDVIQLTDASYDECVKAAKTDEYSDNVPETVEELPAGAQHYIVVTKRNNKEIVAEPSSELRDDNFRNIYVGDWPDKDYLPLRDGVIESF